MYDISDSSSVELFCVPTYGSSNGNSYNIQTVLDDSSIFIGDAYNGIVDIKTGERDNLSLSHGGDGDEVVLLSYKNCLYYFTGGGNHRMNPYGNIRKYDFGESAFKSISDTVDYVGYGVGKDGFYFRGIDIMDGDRDLKFYKFDLRKQMFEQLDITLDGDYVEYEDMSGADGLSRYFYIVDDETFIFYDDHKETFRILEKD